MIRRRTAQTTLVLTVLSLFFAGPVLAAPPAELIVWSGAKPQGLTWAKGGPKTSLKVVAGAGQGGNPKGLVLVLDGDNWKGAGLNWKGWYPPDACDDASGSTALTFYVRQDSKIATADLTIQLVDNLKRADAKPASAAVRLVADGIVPKLDGEWRKVVVPLERFTRDKPLRLDRLWGIDFAHAGKEEMTFHIDRIGFVRDPNAGLFKATAPYRASARVQLDKEIGRVRDEIFGVCGLSAAKRAAYAIPIARWGGNRSSRYNWKLGCDNAGSDWYFLNGGKPIAKPTDTGYLTTILANQKMGASTYQTVPTLGWVAKDATSYGFSVKKYGPQRATEPGKADVGNGVRRDGKPVTGNDPRDTSVEAPPGFIGDAVRLVVTHAGPAKPEAGKPAGVRYWALDNEPMLWHHTHRDVFPKPLGYDELWERTVQYAEAIKAADPTAKVAGFCSWGWTDLFYSAKDAGTDNYTSRPDWQAHGKVPLAEWFIAQCGAYRKKHGKPLVDVFDFHWYPQGQVNGQGPYLGKGLDPSLNALRLRSVRDMWDPDYPQESWIRNTEAKPTAVIRRVKKWIAEHNQGMEVCLGEYNFGGTDNITGGLAQAELFGVLAREGVDLAFVWFEPAGTQDLAWKLYRNYDGKGGRFGDRLLSATSDRVNLGVFAAKRADGAVTVVAVNKDLGGPCELNLDLGTLKGGLGVWRFDPKTGDAVKEVAEQAGRLAGSVRLTLPAASASIMVVRPE